MNWKNEKGFTLIEILIVVVIIGILMVALMPKLGGFTKSSEVSATETDLRVMKNGIQQHFIDNRDQDLTITELNKYSDFQLAKVSGTNPEIYKTTTKVDAWKNPYYVYVSNTDRYISFYSYGPDGVKSNNPQDTKDDIFLVFYPKY